MLPLGEIRWRVTAGGAAPLLYDNHITDEDIDMPLDELEKLVGDGLAKVTCSAGLKDSDYGNGFEAFCSVQLTCNQDHRSVKSAQALAEELLDGALQSAFGAAHEAFNELGPHPRAKKQGR